MKRSFLLLALVLMFSCSALAQKKAVSILGDSYSTFEGWITPATNESWYFDVSRYGTDVVKATDTWWYKYIKDNDCKLCVNNSYSGSTVSYTGYGKADYSERSFLTRMSNLGCPDVIFIFGATNDSWAGSPIGEYKYEGWTRQDFYSFRPSMAYMLSWMTQHYPNVEIYFLLNDGLSKEVNESVDVICAKYEVPVIKLHDIDKKSGHPSIKGMASIAAQIKEFVAR